MFANHDFGCLRHCIIGSAAQRKTIWCFLILSVRFLVYFNIPPDPQHNSTPMWQVCPYGTLSLSPTVCSLSSLRLLLEATMIVGDHCRLRPVSPSRLAAPSSNLRTAHGDLQPVSLHSLLPAASSSSRRSFLVFLSPARLFIDSSLARRLLLLSIPMSSDSSQSRGLPTLVRSTAPITVLI